VPSRPIYALLVLLLVASVPASADIVFTDNTFNPGNYDNFSATPKLDSGVTATYNQCSNCGTPGQALQVLVSTPVTGGGASVGFVNGTFTYDPQTQGAIDSISTSVDKDLTLDRITTDFVSYFYPLIQQGGKFYIASIAGGTINSGTTTGYETISSSQFFWETGLMDTDFGLWNFGPPNLADYGTNPDFSANGAPMTFGLAPIAGANDAFTITVDYDNLYFDIIQSNTGQSPVPESSSMVLLSIFVVGLILRGLGPAIRWKLKRR
jgi:hypothetical protein